MKIFGLGAPELLIVGMPPIALFVGGLIAGIVLWRRARTGANQNSCGTASLVMGIIAAIAASRAHKSITGTNGNNASTAGLILGIVGVAMCVIGLGQTGVLVFSMGD